MNFSNITDLDLEKNLLHWVSQERKVLYLVLVHIQEVEARKIYLERSRTSLYEYLTKDVGYSSASAQRRIEGARLLKEIPQLSGQIQEGRINLSQICEVVRAVKQTEMEVSTDQKVDLLKSIEYKTTAATQQIAAKRLNIEIKELEHKRIQKDESVRIEFTLSKEQNEKYIECRDLASHSLLTLSGFNFSDVFEFLCDHYLKSTSVSETRRVKKSKAVKEVKVGAEPLNSEFRKCLTPKIRREILHRWKVCQYRSTIKDTVCGSSFLLQVDHIQPRWAGGGHQDENLTLLCAHHNRAKYRKEANLYLK